jgi:hypothetical protein
MLLVALLELRQDCKVSSDTEQRDEDVHWQGEWGG